MADHKLVMFPIDGAAPAPPSEPLRAALGAAGFLGRPTKVFGTVHYEQGPRFDALVPSLRPHLGTILGPGMEVRAQVDSRSLCTIAFDGPTREVRFLGGGNTEEPTCTNCGRTVEDWPALISDWYSAPDAHVWACPGCGVARTPWQLDWRRTNGFGRLAIDLWHIHPRQAEPAPELLALLESCTGTAWDYFFYRL